VAMCILDLISSGFELHAVAAEADVLLFGYLVGGL